MRPDCVESRLPALAAGLLGLIVALGGCTHSSASGSASHGPDPDDARLHAEAQADLTSWAVAVAGTRGSPAFVPVGELTGQIGAWEDSNGDFKLSLLSGVVDAAASVPSNPPPPGQIQWSDGSVSTVSLLSASQALDAIRADGTQPCPDCRVLKVTGARMTTQAVDTSRGSAIVPTWAFSVRGTAVEITRVAVAEVRSPVLPTWNPDDPPVGIWIRGAAIAADDRTLTVTFTGAPAPATVPCGEDYVAEAVESDLAVVVIVHRYRYRGGDGTICALVGADRSATVVLAAPLADRAVLEVMQGTAVPVSKTS